jgi:hypothetical protein
MITQEELQNKWYMVKYNLACQVNEHKFMKAKHTDEYTEDAVVHKCSLEAKDLEIHLCEAVTKMHDVLAHVHVEEAVMLQLKIKYAHLTNGSSIICIDHMLLVPLGTSTIH